jgi:hypothetical protein
VQGKASVGKFRYSPSFDFGLWTRQITGELIEQKFGVKLGVTAVGKLLAKLGLTPQKPLQRAYQRDPEAIARWQDEIYPRLAKDAKVRGAEIYFWDESGFRADALRGKTWGVQGQTPPSPGSGNRPRLPRRSMPAARSGL